jgi:hypothetical protein
MQVNNSQLSQQEPNRKFLMLFFLCCTIPFVAAKLALEFSWFTAGVTNKGQWLEKDIQLLPASHTQQYLPQKRWHLVYVQAQGCNSSCEFALYTLQQIYTGFGRQQEQLDSLIVADQTPSQLTRYPAVHWQASNVRSSGLEDNILIVNQEGLAILRYPVLQNREQMLVIGKYIRTDLRRLMAYDRSGI